MIGVQVRHQHHVDALLIDAGGGEIQPSVRPIAPLSRLQRPCRLPTRSRSAQFPPALMTCGLNGTVTMSFGIYAASAAASASAFGTLRTKVSAFGNETRAVVDRGAFNDCQLCSGRSRGAWEPAGGTAACAVGIPEMSRRSQRSRRRHRPSRSRRLRSFMAYSPLARCVFTHALSAQMVAPLPARRKSQVGVNLTRLCSD